MSTGSARANPGTMKMNSVKFLDNGYNAIDILKAMASEIGKDNITGCVKSNGQWIVTLVNKEDVDLLQGTGLKVAGDFVNIVGVTKTLLTVSVFGVPSYIDDGEISMKLDDTVAN